MVTPPLLSSSASHGLLAIDIALLLPPALLEPALRLNAALLPPPHGLRFDATHLPHLTLAQQFVPAAQLPAVTDAAAAALGGVGPLRLLPAGIGRGRTAATLRLAPTADLTRLHTRLMDRLGPFESATGTAAAFYAAGGEPARDADVDWVRRFRTAAAYERFDPHVTVGVGPLPEAAPLPAADAVRVALCQLGRFCTCRRVLADWRLTPREG